MIQHAALGFIVAITAGSLVRVGQEPSSDRDAQVAQYQQHYAAVEQELAERCDDAVTDEQRSARARLLEVLDAYRVRADFGRNYDYLGERMPHFVDNDGRRCAVAELLHASGRDDIVDAVAGSENFA